MKKQSLYRFIESTHTKETAATYLFVINHFLKTHPQAENYQFQDIVDHVNNMKKRGDKPSYRQAKLAAIKRYYDYLIWIGKREDHPCKRLLIKDKSNRDIQIQNLFTSAELEELLDRENRYGNIEARNKVITSLFIYQGIAASELIRLNVEDIDLDKATVYIKGSVKLSRRTLELHRTQISLLYKYIFEFRPKLTQTLSKRLFISMHGMPLSQDSLKRIFEPFRHYYLGRPIHPKSIRMSVIANWLNEQKIPLEEVQLMAGHKYPSTTERYRKKDSEMQRILVNRFHPLR